jgi:hypothetical protein
LIKDGFSGEEEWNQSYGGSGDDRGYSAQQTEDGGYIIAGENKFHMEMGISMFG